MSYSDLTSFGSSLPFTEHLLRALPVWVPVWVPKSRWVPTVTEVMVQPGPSASTSHPEPHAPPVT